MHLQLYFDFCGTVAPWSRVPVALWGRESHRLAAGCTGSSWVHAGMTATSGQLRALARRLSICLVCLAALLLFCSPVSSLHFHVFFSPSQPVLRGALTLGNWLILALCTSIRHRRASKTLPSSASI